MEEWTYCCMHSTLPLKGDEWSASCTGHYGEEKKFFPCQESNQDSLCYKILVQNLIEIHLVVLEFKNTDGHKHLFLSLFC